MPNLGKVVTCWSGQVLDTIDYCAFIGRNPGSSRIFVATGETGQGMTHGVVAGLLIRDLVVIGSSPSEKLYDPRARPQQALETLCAKT